MQGSQKQMTFSTICFGLALLLLVAVYIYNLTNLSNSQEDANLVAHSYQVKAQIEALSSYVKDAERGQRGYLVTQNPGYLTEYHSALGEEKAAINALDQLVKDSTVQQNSLERLTRLIQQRFQTLQEVLVVQEHQGTDAASRLIVTGKGKQLMDAIDAQVAVMLQEEDRLLALRQQLLADAKQKVSFFSMLIFILAVGTLTSAFSLIYASNKKTNLLLAEKNHYAHLLEQSNEELALVAVIASHDLKAPLRKISFFTSEILKDPANTLSIDSQDLFRRIQASAQKMQTLIESILSIAKRQSSEIPVETVNLSQVTKEVTNTLDTLIQQTQGRVEIGEMCPIAGDKSQITQLMQNLIENGLKYHLPGTPPVVSVSARQTPDHGFEIRVKDNGIGMDQEHQLTAFQMFKRLPGAKPYEGTGVGLGHVKSIVERHHGSVHVNSAPGKGAEFVVYIPQSKG